MYTAVDVPGGVAVGVTTGAGVGVAAGVGVTTGVGVATGVGDVEIGAAVTLKGVHWE